MKKDKINPDHMSREIHAKYQGADGQERGLSHEINGAVQVAHTAAVFSADPTLAEAAEGAIAKGAINWQFLESMPQALKTGEFMENLMAYHRAYIGELHETGLHTNPHDCKLVFSFLHHLINPDAPKGKIYRHAIETMLEKLELGEVMPAEEIRQKSRQLTIIAEKSASTLSYLASARD